MVVKIEDTGLSVEDTGLIQSVFARHPNIKKVLLYGSRAMGNFRPASDIDLAIIGKNIDLSQLFEIEHQLDDLYLPYKIDVAIYDQIENPDLLEHISRVGKIFYEGKG